MAKVQIPSRINEVNIFVQGAGFLGLVESMPVLFPKTKKETQGRLHVDTGLLEPQEVEFELRGVKSEVVKEVAKLHNASITGKGSFKVNGEDKGAVVEYTGSIDLDMEAWKSGDGQTLKIKMYPNIYSVELEGQTLVDVDETNMIARIGEEDLYKKIRGQVS